MRPTAQEIAAFSTPAAGAQATCSFAAPAANQRFICTSISATLSGTAAGTATLNLRNGASGAGTILWSKQVTIPANGIWECNLADLLIAGAYGAALTLEFAAGVATDLESVAMTGYLSA
jgi:hypothetical protein